MLMFFCLLPIINNQYALIPSYYSSLSDIWILILRCSSITLNFFNQDSSIKSPLQGHPGKAVAVMDNGDKGEWGAETGNVSGREGKKGKPY